MNSHILKWALSELIRGISFGSGSQCGVIPDNRFHSSFIYQIFGILVEL